MKTNPYKFMFGQKQSAMIAETHLLSFAEHNDEFTLSRGVTDVIREQDNGVIRVYFSDKSVESSYVNGKVFLEKELARDLLLKISNTQSDFREFLITLRNTNHAGLSNDDLADLIKQYRKHHIFLHKLFRASEQCGTKLVEDGIWEILSERHSTIVDLFLILITPTELDRTQQELIDWYKLSSTSNHISDDDLLKHAFNYPANFTNTWSYGEIISYLRRRLAKENLYSLKQEINRIKKFKLETRKKQEDIYVKFENSELRYYSELLQKLALTRFDLKHAWAGAETLCLNFLKHIAERIKIDFKTFMASYNYSDIINYFENGISLSEDKVRERMDYSIIHYKDDKILYLFGQEAKDHFSKLHQIKTSDELTGKIANSGSAKGFARIVKVGDLVRFNLDIKRFQEGEILITTMTSPLMAQLASKAGAIVTDEGGILSHAGVIARELGKPCIVGTHDATRIFKDGDFVEVDADNGVIKMSKFL